MSKTGCTWKKVDGRYRCMAVKCPHWMEGGGCELGKVTLSCDNMECVYNSSDPPVYGYGCLNMDVHLDADGKCLGFKAK